jgi:phage recombination protein Bet
MSQYGNSNSYGNSSGSNRRTPQQPRATQARQPPQPPVFGEPPPAQLPAAQDKPASIADERVIEFTPLGEDQPIKLTMVMVRNSNLIKPTKRGELPSDAVIQQYMMVCKQRRLNPWAGDCFLVGYDTQDGPVFNIIVAVQSLFKRAEINEQFDGIRSGVIVTNREGKIEEREGDFFLETDKLVGGWAEVHRKDRQFPFYQRLAISVYRKPTSQWDKDPAGMIVKCAESGALRQAFPSDIGGLYLDMEMQEHNVVTAVDVKPAAAAPAAPPPPGNAQAAIKERLSRGDSKPAAKPAAAPPALPAPEPDAPPVDESENEPELRFDQTEAPEAMDEAKRFF